MQYGQRKLQRSITEMRRSCNARARRSARAVIDAQGNAGTHQSTASAGPDDHDSAAAQVDVFAASGDAIAALAQVPQHRPAWRSDTAPSVRVARPGIRARYRRCRYARDCRQDRNRARSVRSSRRIHARASPESAGYRRSRRNCRAVQCRTRSSAHDGASQTHRTRAPRARTRATRNQRKRIPEVRTSFGQHFGIIGHTRSAGTAPGRHARTVANCRA